MGIISDFLNLKQQVEEYQVSGGIFRNVIYHTKKQQLFKSAEKLVKANEPLERDQVLELAQSLHGLSVGYGEGFFENKVKVEYFPGNESYRLTILPETFEDTDIRSFEVIVSSKSKNMELFVQIQESEEIIKGHRLNIPTIHTNIKELKDFISVCNHQLYTLIYLYIHDMLSEMS